MPQQQGDSGTIVVIVQRKDTGASIPKALVRLNSTPPAYRNLDSTDATGRLVFTNLEPRDYSVFATAPGFALGASSAVTLKAGEERTIVLRLGRGAVITGRVRDARGSPLPNVTVRTMRLVYRNGLRTLASGGASAKTDDRGLYRLPDLEPGAYYFRSDVSSEASAAGLPRITYYPGVTEAGLAAPVTVVADEEIAGVDFDIPPQRTFRISGTLGSPFPCGVSLPGGLFQMSAAVFLMPRDSGFVDEQPLRLDLSYVPTRTGEGHQWRFEFSGIPSGEYELLPECGYNGGNHTARTLVTVRTENLEDVRIGVNSSILLSGRIVFEGSLRQRDWSGVQVRLAPMEQIPASRPLIGFPHPTTLDFSFQDVSDGKYAVAVSGLPKSFYVADIRYGAASVPDGVLEIASTERPSLSIVLREGSGSADGIVLDASGQPVAGSIVVLTPAPARRQNLQLYQRAIAGNDGRFHLYGIAPGSYKLFAWPTAPPDSAEYNAAFLARFEVFGVPVAVAGGTLSTANVRLISISERF
jgi:protocatechuate 3,4-dioxygenase beta subunit